MVFNPESGVKWAPDGSPGDPPSEGERHRKIGTLFRSILFDNDADGVNPNEIIPSGVYDPTMYASAHEAWPFSEEYKNFLNKSKDLWTEQAGELGLPPGAWNRIAKTFLDVNYWANTDKIDGEVVDPKRVAAALGFFKAMLVEILGDKPEDVELINQLVERKVDQVNSVDGARRRSGDVEMQVVNERYEKIKAEREKQQENARKAAEEKRAAEEKEAEKKRLQEELNTLAERLGTLGPEKIKKIKEDFVLNLQLPEDKQRTISQILGDEALRMVGPMTTEMRSDRGSIAYWYEVLRRAYESVEYPKARMELRKRLVEQFYECLNVSPETVIQYVKDLLEPVKWAYFTGEFSKELWGVVPEGMTLRDYSDELEAMAMVIGYESDAPSNRIRDIARKLGIKMNGSKDEIRRRVAGGEVVAEEDVLRMQQLDELMDEKREERMLGNVMAERGVKDYIFLPQNQEIILGAKKMAKKDKNIRIAWVQRLYLAMLRAGRNSGVAQMYAGAVSGDMDAYPEESSISRGVGWIQKASQLEGYNKREEEHRAFGFQPPEVLSEIVERAMPVSVKLRDVRKDRPDAPAKIVDFTISMKDVEAELLHIDRLAQFNANKGTGTDSHAEMQMMIMRRAMLRKMGYTSEQINMWDGQQRVYDRLVERGLKARADSYKSTWDSHYPEVIRTSLISFTDLLDVDNLDSLCGDMWGLIIGADADIRWKRTDYMLLPTEKIKRRPRLSSRDALADYARLYDKWAPPGQLWQEMAILPDYDSYIMMEALVDVLSSDEILARGLDLSTDRGKAMLEVRRQWVEGTVKVDQIAPDQAKWLGAMLMGVGYFEPEGDTPESRLSNYFGKVSEAMKSMERLEINRQRPFELWPDAVMAFDEELLKKAGLEGRRGMGRAVLEGEELAARVWDGVPFESWIQKEGLNQAEMERLRYRGFIERFKEELKASGAGKQVIDRMTNVNDIGEVMENYRAFYEASLPPLPPVNTPEYAQEKQRRVDEVRQRISGGRRELGGAYGWKCFLENASYSLYERWRAAYKSQDSEERYPEPAKGNIDQAGQGLELGIEKIAHTEKPNSAADKLPASVVFMSGGKAERKGVPDTFDPQSARQLEEQMNHIMEEMIQPVAKEQSKLTLGGFIPKLPTATLYLSYVRSYMEYWLAFHTTANALVYDVETDNPDFGAANSLSLRQITQASLRKRWAELFADSRGRVVYGGVEMTAGEAIEKYWRRHMVYYVESAESMQKPEAERQKNRVAIGETSTFLPNVRVAGELLKEMIHVTEHRLEQIGQSGKMARNKENPLRNFLHILEEMRDYNQFGWSLLRGKPNMTVVEVAEVVVEPLLNKMQEAYAEAAIDELVQLQKNGVASDRMDMGGFWVWPNVDKLQKYGGLRRLISKSYQARSVTYNVARKKKKLI